ncbi:ethanolamine phosphotransferase [Novymonas esmeraldas]|uniref:Ethanolamine phosphotransferase n=1 Tax=Novymonas esmeraldas TaxID=1808958 RepID=A0AAW0ENZ6_9TRYP
MGRLARVSWWPGLLLMVVYTGSVLLFTTSMLSTSTVMRTVSTEPCHGLQVPPVDQVVLIVIDAMRPDFVLSSLRLFARTGGQCAVHEDALGHQRVDDVYTGPTLQYMEQTLRSDTAAAVAFFFVADAPTTTAQRIKAIATGTMPAFLEAGSNFNSDALELDSIVGQMNGSAVLLGDDTWEKLLPNTAARRYWKKAVGIPSFDVADFDTNDDAVLAEVFDVLSSETAEAAAPATSHARLIVAHFLGIDHIGHRIDADNPFMRGKILQLDQMLRNVSRTLLERPTAMNTMLLVLGDHGMTNSGDHGGGSAQETDSFLFAQYFPGAHADATRASPLSSPGANLAMAKRYVEQRWRDRVDAEFDRLRSCRARAGVPHDRLGATYQVDVTTTIAVLLGRPIPYSSFGRVMPELLVLANASVNVDAAEECNLRQLQRYFRESEMKVPRDAAWTATAGASTAQRLADMSFYARRTRTDMNRRGMFLGSTALLLCAMSLLWSPAIRAHMLPGSRAGWVMRWTAVVLVLRLCSVFSNSFVVNEDSEVLGLLSSLLALLLVPRALAWWRRHHPESRSLGRADTAAPEEAVFLGALLLGMRLAVPVLLRYRAHISHTVEAESAVDRALLELPAAMRVERLGTLVGGVMWTVLYPHHVSRLVVALTCGCIALAYHVPVAHHAVPLLCAAVYPLASRWPASLLWRHRRAGTGAAGQAAYAYLVLVLWLTTLCNARVATAVVVAVYGTSLPALCHVLRVEPVLTQAVVLHLAAFVAFFAEGHQCMLNTIDWNSSFVGMPGYNLYAGGALVLSRTFHVFLLVPFALRVSPAAVGAATHMKGSAGHHGGAVGAGLAAASSDSVVVCVYAYLMLVQSAVSCFNGYIQKTHLMLFPIFCPKLLFDAVIALLTGGAALAVLVLGPAGS